MTGEPPRSQAATAPMLKALNERTVFETIRSHHPISRAEISRRVGISKPTVSAALAALLDGGLVRETVRGGGGPTYGALFFEPVPEAGFVVGLDIGGRYLRGVLAALDGEERAREQADIGPGGIAEVVAQAAAMRRRLLERAAVPPGTVQVAVVAVPGVVERATGKVYQGTTIAGLDGFALADALADAFDHAGPRGPGRAEVLLENDIHLAALGEQWKGVGAKARDFAVLSVGTGTGAALVLGGRLHRGRNGTAGEIDFAFEGGVDANPFDPCGPALVRLAADWAEFRDADTALRPPVTPEQIFAAARAGDRLAGLLVAEEARRIAVYLAPICAVADVELAVLAGGIGLNADLLLEPVRGELGKRVPYPPRVEVSALGEAGALTGAIARGTAVALDRVLASRIGGGPA
ncbi:ROK family transcriptional regulator [Actinocrinis puniceicyclus]|uniref:ROK family transcriptional regulator n=1 Tax=Actinocrinis puniceicyclus TaxID=977794 RepID=A0A8J7WHU3_9ACTN|nr:ROK family transcriptional regulator [Actinocrinis puniceicyclus]MBS2961593.1 ROK family transcriptional regulator [Actinocrinis puniceicyclus]